MAISPGEVYAIPLLSGGWARVVVARSGSGVFLGLYFGPRLNSLHSAGVQDLVPKSARLTAFTFSSEIDDGVWKLCDEIAEFSHVHWPVPKFAYRDPLTMSYFCREFDDRDPFGAPIRIRPISPGDAQSLPTHVYRAGPGLANELDRLL
jgi:hypothetical protein